MEDSVISNFEPQDRLPGSEFHFTLSDRKRTIERSFYSFMTLIGDVGGFNSAIILFPTFIMSFFSSRIFDSSVYSDMPKKKKYKKRNGLNNKAAL